LLADPIESISPMHLVEDERAKLVITGTAKDVVVLLQLVDPFDDRVGWHVHRKNVELAREWGVDKLVRLPRSCADLPLPRETLDFLVEAGLPGLFHSKVSQEIDVTFCRLARGIASVTHEEPGHIDWGEEWSSSWVIGDEFYCRGAAWWWNSVRRDDGTYSDRAAGLEEIDRLERELREIDEVAFEFDEVAFEFDENFWPCALKLFRPDGPDEGDGEMRGGNVLDGAAVLERGMY